MTVIDVQNSKKKLWSSDLVQSAGVMAILSTLNEKWPLKILSFAHTKYYVMVLLEILAPGSVDKNPYFDFCH